MPQLMQRASAIKAAPKDETANLKAVSQRYKYRAYTMKHLVTNTWQNLFVADNFAGDGQDLAEDAAAVNKPGDSSYNNWLSKEQRPMFRFQPRALGFHISDPGDVRVKSILLENARLEVYRNKDRFVNEPVHALPPGLSVRRRTMTTNSDATLSVEEHEADEGIGMFKVPDGMVLETDETIKMLLYVEPAALAALAAIGGNAPAQGFTLGVILYGDAFGTGGTSI